MLPGNTGSHFTHDLTLGLRIAATVQLGFSLTGDRLQLGNRELTSARAHKTKHTKGERRMLNVCLLLRLQNKGKRLAQVLSESRWIFLTLPCRGSFQTEVHVGWTGPCPKESCILAAYPAKNAAGWGQEAVLIASPELCLGHEMFGTVPEVISLSWTAKVPELLWRCL